MLLLWFLPAQTDRQLEVVSLITFSESLDGGSDRLLIWIAFEGGRCKSEAKSRCHQSPHVVQDHCRKTGEPNTIFREWEEEWEGGVLDVQRARVRMTNKLAHPRCRDKGDGIHRLSPAQSANARPSSPPPA